MGVYITVLTFIVFDILTGFIKGLYNSGLNSTALRKGLYHKVTEVLALIGSGLLEYGIAYVNLGVDLPLLNIVAIYLCTTELVSILENLGEVNPTLKKLFKVFLEKLKSETEE